MTRLLLDQGVPRSTTTLLREAGIDATHAAELGLSRARDTDIIDIALADERTVVTLDADFHAIISVSGATRPSVVRIREEGLRGPALADLLQRVIGQAGDALRAGALVTAKTRTLRIRRLPVTRGE